MTLTDLDALIERLRNSLGTNWPWTWNLAGEAAAALVQLRERIAALEAGRADLIKINNKWAGEWDTMRDTLIRLSKWDHLDNAADGPFWKREIANAVLDKEQK